MLRSLLISAYMLLPLAAAAQAPGDLEALTRAEQEARDAEKRLAAERETVLQDIAALKRDLNERTAALRDLERRETSLGADVGSLQKRADELGVQLDASREETAELVAALQRIGLAPPGWIASNPDNALDSAEAAALIDILSSELSERTERTRELLGAVERNRSEAEAARTALRGTRTELDSGREALREALARKTSLRKQVETDRDAARAEASRLAAESRTLRELLDRLSEEAARVRPRVKPAPDAAPRAPRLPPGTVAIAEAKGGLLRPVSGKLVRAFGRGESGQTWGAPGEGQVVAPYAGEVEFAGPFKAHGRVVILNFGDGYYALLSGMEQTYVSASETVGRGEPVGQMPAGGSSTLYLELRRNGQTIDPAPWLAESRVTSG